MAQLCTFNDPAMSSEFASSWKLCLECIFSYTNVSSIAKKSCSLLRDSARHLLPENSSQKVVIRWRDVDHNTNITQNPPLPNQETSTQGPFQANRDQSPMDGPVEREWHLTPPGTDSELQLMMNFVSEQEPGLAPLDAPDGDMWANETGDDPYWPFMPFLSQLETLRPSFDTSNLE
jgi:hypothetical protein